MFTDFQYGNKFASDFGLMVCSFDALNGTETVSSGSNLTLNTAKSVGQDKFELYGTNYGEPYTFTFQLCKLSSLGTPLPLIPEEYGEINRWLNRKTYDTFKINTIGYENIRFIGTFNIQYIKINKEIYGIECTFTSNAPYAYEDERILEFSNKSFYIYDDSDEIGEIYPNIVITCKENGELKIQNSADNEILIIKNCKLNEVININGKYKIITSSDLNHNIANDFNYNFLKIINSYDSRDNNFSSTLNIDIKLNYSPIRKVGI